MRDKIREDEGASDRLPIIVTRSNGRRAVVISFDDYMKKEETLHLMSSRENIRVIDRAIAELITFFQHYRQVYQFLKHHKQYGATYA